jgi:hypothetical protein
LKRIIDEKNAREHQLSIELKFLNEKFEKVDRENGKLQADLDVMSKRYHDMVRDSETYASNLQNIQNQLTIAELKRTELKQDAQETVKLYVYRFLIKVNKMQK